MASTRTPLATRPVGQAGQRLATPMSTGTRTLLTPNSGLTPNDDAAEKAESRRHRRKEQLRRSLADAFADGDKENARGGVNGSTAKVLDHAQITHIFDTCLKLAAENKITDRNIWALPLIDYLPDIVRAEAASEGSGFSFQKMSGGLDAGVTIFSKRVDMTWKMAFTSLHGCQPGGNDGEGGDADGEDGGEGDTQAAPGARGKRRGGADLKESDTLADAASLRMKPLDATFDVDPLFHRTSALFDEGGAHGMLLNNTSVFGGCSIMFDANGVPQALFSAAEEEPVGQVDLSAREVQRVLQELQAMPAQMEISPAISELYALLGDAGGQADASVASIMEAATRHRTADAPWRASTSTCATANGDDDSMQTSRDSASAQQQQDQQDEEEQSFEAGMFQDNDGGGFDAGYADDGGDDAGTGGNDWFDCGGDDDGGGGLEPASAEVRHAGQQQAGFGAAGGSEGGDGAADGGVLSEDAVQWLLDAGAGKGALTRGAGWAGTSYWRFRSAAQLEQPVRKAAGKKRKAAESTLDFEALPPVPKNALQQGSRKQTCLSTFTPGNTLLPPDLHYEASSLGLLFLNPSAGISASRRATGAGAGTAAPDAPYWAAGGDQNGSSDQYDDGGYGDDGDGGDYGADGDDGGDAGDYGWGTGPSGEGGEGVDAEHELLQAPRRVAQVGVAYSRSAKQVDVRALKDTLWQGLVDAQRHNSDHMDEDEHTEQSHAPISFQQVIQLLPQESAAGRLQDLSVHMCFICMLHLANEHGLAIKGTPDLSGLAIHVGTQ